MFNDPNLVKFRLAICTPDPGNLTSMARVMGPFNMMAREDRRLELVLPPKVPSGDQNFAWEWLMGCDGLYVQGASTDAHRAIIKIAHWCGIPVWADWDDNYFHVRPSNPAWAKNFNDPVTMRQTVKELEEDADIVTCVTETLRGTMTHPDKVRIIPNACAWPEFPAGERKKVVTWRGLSSHVENMESMLPAIAEVANMPQYSQWKWVFFGDPQPKWKIMQAVPDDNLIFPEWRPTPFQFINSWAASHPYINLAPHVSCPFSRAQPPSAWLESSAIGAACIGSRMPEWEVPGAILYDKPEELAAILKREMDTFDEGKPHPAVAVSRAEIYPKRTLDVVNQLRWSILNEMAGCPDKKETNGHEIIIPNFARVGTTESLSASPDVRA